MKRPIIHSAISFALGIIWCRLFGWSAISTVVAVLLDIACLVIYSTICAKRMCGTRLQVTLAVSAAVAALFVISFESSAAAMRAEDELLGHCAQSDVTLTARVKDISAKKIILDECILEDNTFEHQAFEYQIIVFLTSGKPDVSNVRIGNIVSLTGDFFLLDRGTNPGQFDSFDYYFVRGIGGGFYPDNITVLSEDVRYVEDFLHSVASYVSDTLGTFFDANDHAELVALTMGDKSELSEETGDMYKNNGIMHIMAISGLHISLLGMGVYHLLKRMRMRREFAFPLAAASAVLYSLMTGMSVSAGRALIMMMILLLGEMFGKSYDSLTAVSFAMIGELFDEPLLLFDCSFLLSYGAVIGMALWLTTINKLIKKQKERGSKEKTGEAGVHRILRGVGTKALQLLAPGISVYLVILPVLLYFYYELPVYALLINLIVAPLVTPIFVAVLLIVLIPFPPVQFFIAGVPHYILELYAFICKCTEKLPYHTIISGRPEFLRIVLYYALLIFMLYCIKKGKKCGGAVGTFLIVLFALFVPLFSTPEAVFLDVGQGDGICVMADNSCFMIDGGSSSEKKLEKYVLTPFLKSEGVAVVDGWFLTHSDKDHISGITDILNLLKRAGIKKPLEETFATKEYRGYTLINTIFLPYCDGGFEEILELAEEIGIRVVNLGVDDAATAGDLEFVCESPNAKLHSDSDNENSLVLSVRFRGADKMLLTGDIGGEQEKALTERLKSSGRSYEVLKVAHHGSKYSTSSEFLECIGDGGLAVISAGKNNRYGHPHAETVERLERAGREVIVTAQTGAVEYEME